MLWRLAKLFWEREWERNRCGRVVNRWWIATETTRLPARWHPLP